MYYQKNMISGIMLVKYSTRIIASCIRCVAWIDWIWCTCHGNWIIIISKMQMLWCFSNKMLFINAEYFVLFSHYRVLLLQRVVYSCVREPKCTYFYFIWKVRTGICGKVYNFVSIYINVTLNWLAVVVPDSTHEKNLNSFFKVLVYKVFCNYLLILKSKARTVTYNILYLFYLFCICIFSCLILLYIYLLKLFAAYLTFLILVYTVFSL